MTEEERIKLEIMEAELLDPDEAMELQAERDKERAANEDVITAYKTPPPAKTVEIDKSRLRDELTE